MPRARVSVHLSRSAQPARLGGARPGDAGARRHQTPHQHLRPDAHDLHGRPASSVGDRRSHLEGLLDRPVAGRHARRRHDAHQDGMDSPERSADERQGDDDRVLRPQRRRLDPHVGVAGPGVPHRTARQERGFRAGRPQSAARRTFSTNVTPWSRLSARRASCPHTSWARRRSTKSSRIGSTFRSSPSMAGQKPCIRNSWTS